MNDISGLDWTYTVFGEIFRGMEVLDKVAAVRDDCDNPLEPMTVKEQEGNRQPSFLLAERAR